MNKEEYGIACGELTIELNQYYRDIVGISCDNKECNTPYIILSLIQKYGMEDIKDILETLYCKKFKSNNYCNTCGKVIARKLSKLTFN